MACRTSSVAPVIKVLGAAMLLGVLVRTVCPDAINLVDQAGVGVELFG